MKQKQVHRLDFGVAFGSRIFFLPHAQLLMLPPMQRPLHLEVRFVVWQGKLHLRGRRLLGMLPPHGKGAKFQVRSGDDVEPKGL